MVAQSEPEEWLTGFEVMGLSDQRTVDRQRFSNRCQTFVLVQSCAIDHDRAAAKRFGSVFHHRSNAR